VSSWDPKYPPNSLPLAFLPDSVGAVLGLLLMTWGLVALWWLVVGIVFPSKSSSEGLHMNNCSPVSIDSIEAAFAVET